MSTGDKRAFFQLDVGYFDNPKIADLVEDHPRAVILHERAIAYSAQHLTDGIFPMRLVMRLVCVPRCGPQCGSHCQPQCALGLLVQYGLVRVLDETEAEVHDYLEHQRSAKSIGKAKAAGQRAAESRWKVQKDAEGNADRIADGNAESMRNPMPRERERERERVSTKDSSTGSAVGPATPDTFPEFWDAYPRKEVKKKSIPAYRSALKRVSAEQLLKGAERYRDDPNRDPGFTALPTTWLTGDRWEDEPLPPRSGKQTNDQKVNSGLTLAQQLYAEEQAQIEHTHQPQIEY